MDADVLGNARQAIILYQNSINTRYYLHATGEGLYEAMWKREQRREYCAAILSNSERKKSQTGKGKKENEEKKRKKKQR